MGVLCVQHAEPRRYEDIEIEALQTVAMVLSELISNAGLVDEAKSGGARTAQGQGHRLTGLKLVDGMAKGHAVYHQPRILIVHTVAEDTEAERARVYSAFKKMREQIDTMAAKSSIARIDETGPWPRLRISSRGAPT